MILTHGTNSVVSGSSGGAANAYLIRADYNSNAFTSAYNYDRQYSYSLRLIKDY